MSGGQKKKAYGAVHTLPNRHISGAIFASFLPCKAFSKGGQGYDTFLPVSPKYAFQGIKKAPVFLLEICLKTDAM